MSSHPNKALQHDWDADGREGFELEVLDVLPPPKEPDTDLSDDLETLLHLWTEKLDIDSGVSY
ncbi:MAG: GIY-YIG nuclease family protein [Acidimicrobiia bacterium]|nr:GIY-YIG nuclease family protein [Acidimicrobiia bacterium]